MCCYLQDGGIPSCSRQAAERIQYITDSLPTTNQLE